MKKHCAFLVAALLLISTELYAKSKVSITIQCEKEVTRNHVAQRVAADPVTPGDVIFYTLNYVNSGDETATNVVLNDPIPKGTVYLAGSAFGANAEITFSIDNGKTFKKPSLLTYEVALSDGRIEKRTVSPEKYTHIRWTIGMLPAFGSGQAGFQTRVK